MSNATVWDVNNRAYHSDHTKVGSSQLRDMLDSPAKYHDIYVSRTRHDEPTPDMALGSAVHCLVLEPESFGRLFCCRPEGIDGRTKDGKEKLAAWRAATIGREELTAEASDKAHAMAEAVLREPALQRLLDECGSKPVIERAIAWEEDVAWVDGTGKVHVQTITQKCRPDWFLSCPHLDYDFHLDLKTTTDPTPATWFSPSTFNPMRGFGYDLQVAAHYPAGVEELTGRPCESGVVCVRKSPPHDVYIHRTSIFRDCGEAWRQRALRMLAYCTETGCWRDPDQEQVNVPPPGWTPPLWWLPRDGE